MLQSLQLSTVPREGTERPIVLNNQSRGENKRTSLIAGKSPVALKKSRFETQISLIERPTYSRNAIVFLVQWAVQYLPVGTRSEKGKKPKSPINDKGQQME